MEGSNDSLSVLAPTMGGSSAVLLTPGRTRNIAQDMEALRLSRQDNPYLQQVMASRESLIDSHADECESDDTILMTQEFGSTALDFVEDDPLTLKEVHEHMIRSPPPITSWPHDSLSHRTSSAFEFGVDSRLAYSAYSVDSHDKDIGGRSPRRARDECSNGSRTRSSRSASPRSHDLSLCGRPLSLPVHHHSISHRTSTAERESHLRTALNKKSCQSSERFSLLPHSLPLRSRRVTHVPHTDRDDDNVRLVRHCD